ncbi:hydrogenase nickel incorporation protein HypB [Maritimibacter fusiformis]|uniref:Hydrogenase maturation factor HypB n=1 Tax=Maritimibacter fusiformis TaxID=2603819 RepID=A0A5D0RN02_9RHOB|nr:hydrogenase nickel incorporation protein HypB [Maritimibacter fusiformis]TYB82519.1 hydrogenase nickel incorporation protein HypB [Maritimibacter fusiformis]
MCTTCGCGEGEVRIEGASEGGAGGHAHHHHHHHGHDHHHHHHEAENGDMHFGTGLGGSHTPGMSQTRIVQIEQDILSKNDHLAAHNREDLARAGVLALNLVSSPGSGKTTLLARTARDMAKKHPIAVIEGDQQTTLDADRIRETGARAIQVNTGKGCHLDADMVGRAIHKLAPEKGSLLFIENVGNLVCPAGFDLGEAAKVVILSVTEGEDKPLKYPDMFRAARLMVLNKSDLLPYVPFDVDKCIEYARRVNPQIGVLTVSALTGEGLDTWYAWIEAVRAEQVALAGASG